MDRSEKILAAIDRGMRILELGPSYSPLAPKRDGWKTTTVDHASREDLVHKYRNEPGVDVSQIEDVDVVWADGPLDAAVPTELHGGFDACIASHVLEHVPDPIGLLEALERLLTPTGLVSLALPDKRFCLDYFKSLSSVGELLEAHERRATRHSLTSRFDHLAYTIRSAGEVAWGRRVVDDVTFMSTLGDAKRELDEIRAATDDGMYVDSHAWRFTPSSFALAILELAAIGEIDFHVDGGVSTGYGEFYVTLRRGREGLTPDELEARRLDLLRATLVDLREQTDFLPTVALRETADAPAPPPPTPPDLHDALAALRAHVRVRTRLRAAAAAARRRFDTL